MEIIPYKISIPTKPDNYKSSDEDKTRSRQPGVYYDEYKTGIKQLSDLKKLKPIEQLGYLSQVVEMAHSDTAYAMFDAYKVFEDVEKDEGFSPLLKILAQRGAESCSEDYLQRQDESDEFHLDEQEYGYSTIVAPGMIPEGVLTPIEEKMSEEEIKLEIARLESSDLVTFSNSMGLDLEDKDYEGEKGYEVLSDYHTRLSELELALSKKIFDRNQKRLHQEFPSLPTDRQLVKVASDAAATIEFEEKEDYLGDSWLDLSTFDTIADQSGKILYGAESQSGLNEEALDCLITIHNNAWMKNKVEETISLKLVEIPIEAQAQLLKFMTEASNERFDKMCAVMQNIEGKDLRRRLLENFVAADFGEDFGDALLDIASSERLSKDEKAKVFDTISSCRESIGKITDFYTGFDNGKFAKQYARASNERLTDAITVFRQIAKTGVASTDLGWAGKTRFNFEEACEALGYEMKSLEIISGTLGDIQSGAKDAFAEVVLARDESNQRLNRTFYNFYSPRHGYVLLYTRPEGSHSFDPATEYGKVRSRYRLDSANTGVEASISLITNPVDPFSLISPFRPDAHATKNPQYYNPDTMNKVSGIRLDREGRAPGMAANDDSRDTINPIGMISVDLAAIGDRYDTPSGKIARLISLGNLLRSKDHGTGFSLNHNTNWFNQDEYGTSEGFRKIVEYIDEVMVKLCLDHPPRRGDLNSFKERMKRARGDKTLRVLSA